MSKFYVTVVLRKSKLPFLKAKKQIKVGNKLCEKEDLKY